ncbi:MAG TPA: efflux RND transporter periplasmic adaptor subunit [Candidatus Deferrimicrobium sp.]|nr:efflux RND transporter periplasmic adaptor subunit [Candidatus Deferrimicrobium sp.]
MSGKKLLTMLLLLALGVALGAIGSRWLTNSHSEHVAVVTEGELCKEHNVPESQCTRCHPELITVFKAKGDWCGEHNLPESQCDLCGGEAESSLPLTIASTTQSAGMSPTSERTRANELSVFFRDNEVGCATDGAVIQFASVKTIERAGLTVQPAILAPNAPVVEAPAELVFDETRTTAVTTTVPALVSRWFVEPGQLVDEGQVLAELDSPEMPILKGDYLEAEAEFAVGDTERQRQEQLRRQNLISEGDYQAAMGASQVLQAHLTRCEGLLRAAGIAESDLQSLKSQQSINARFALRAPVRGIVVKRLATLGDLNEAGTKLAVISEPGSLWMEAQVRERDLRRVRVGQNVEFSADANGLQRTTGEIIWVAQFLDPSTRTGTVRARLAANGPEQRPGEFGRAAIFTEAEELAVLIPKDAVQWEGCCNVVFVRETTDRYRPRKVRVDVGDNGHYRITDGLSAGEEIVVNGSYLLKTELRKGSIGAGCVDE